MDSSDKIMAGFFTGILGVILAIIIGFTTYSMSVTNRIAEAIAAGANPVEASCAYYGGNSPECLIYAINKK